MKALVLLSGGVDSTTCLAIAVEKYGREEVLALSVSYGQKHSKELTAAKAVADYYGVPLRTLDLSVLFEGSDCSLLQGSGEAIPEESYSDQLQKTGGKPVSTYVPFRNGLFLSSAASVALSNGCEEIYYGAHSDDAAGNAYPDCTPEFNESISRAVYLGSGGQLRVPHRKIRRRRFHTRDRFYDRRRCAYGYDRRGHSKSRCRRRGSRSCAFAHAARGGDDRYVQALRACGGGDCAYAGAGKGIGYALRYQRIFGAFAFRARRGGDHVRDRGRAVHKDRCRRMKEYFVSVAASAVISAICTALASGTELEKYVKYVCSLVCAAAVALPLVSAAFRSQPAELPQVEYRTLSEPEYGGYFEAAAVNGVKEYVASLVFEKTGITVCNISIEINRNGGETVVGALTVYVTPEYSDRVPEIKDALERELGGKVGVEVSGGADG